MTSGLMERLQLIGLHGSLVLVQVRKRILRTIMMRVVIGINGLCLQTRNCIELLDRCCSEASQGTEDRTLDLCNLCVLDSIDDSILRLRRVILQLLGGVF